MCASNYDRFVHILQLMLHILPPLSPVRNRNGVSAPVSEVKELKVNAFGHEVVVKYADGVSNILPRLDESDEMFDAKWVGFFNIPTLDEYELKQGFNDLLEMYDAVPEPEVFEAALRAAKRVNNFAIATRIIEGINYKSGGDKKIYNYIMEKLKPTLDELGISTLEELGYDKVRIVYFMHAFIYTCYQ